MTFHITGCNFSIRGSVLSGTLENRKQEPVEAHIDLNTCIGNDDGCFEWGGVNFAETAQNITIEIESHGVILQADLESRDGKWIQAQINLGDRIENIDGQFQFQGTC